MLVMDNHRADLCVTHGYLLGQVYVLQGGDMCYLWISTGWPYVLSMDIHRAGICALCGYPQGGSMYYLSISIGWVYVLFMDIHRVGLCTIYGRIQKVLQIIDKFSLKSGLKLNLTFNQKQRSYLQIKK